MYGLWQLLKIPLTLSFLNFKMDIIIIVPHIGYCEE